MAAITTSDIRAYIAAQQQETPVFRSAFTFTARDGSKRHVPELRDTVDAVSNGEINRELTVLKRMFSLSIQSGKLLQKPHIALLKEHNVRVGFFERDQFQAVLQRLAPAVRAVFAFTDITGWRIDSEVLPLEWRQVDFEGGEVRLDPGSTKNGQGGTFPMTTELRGLLERQRELTETAQRRYGSVCRQVFHRGGHPKLPGCVSHSVPRCGMPGRVLHDLRRTAVRNLVRAGIPERVAMQMTDTKPGACSSGTISSTSVICETLRSGLIP